ncbi:Hok/Gef family protein [Enterovibrio norvegicus]|uniref:Hok/Gef family protein n=1 Tax=Enterovibrio norvegicus TaxID=188144 RepID=A0ABV4L5P7_9GAMM
MFNHQRGLTMCDNWIIASYLTGGKFMPKKTVLVTILVLCVTAVLLTALFRDSLCEFHYKGSSNDLHIKFAYEVS